MLDFSYVRESDKGVGVMKITVYFGEYDEVSFVEGDEYAEGAKWRAQSGGVVIDVTPEEFAEWEEIFNRYDRISQLITDRCLLVTRADQDMLIIVFCPKCRSLGPHLYYWHFNECKCCCSHKFDAPVPRDALEKDEDGIYRLVV